MKTSIENEIFDYKIETSDWRYNAAIVGLIKYFNFLSNSRREEKKELYEINEDTIKYNSKKITKENYLLFVEYYFKDAMHHKVVEDLISREELTKEQIELLNAKLKANSIMKSIFGKISYSEENKEEILKKINENRITLIKDTYIKGKSLYSNFMNEGALFKEKDKVCRIVGYYIDVPKKGKSIAYNWNFNTYEAIDDSIFDFIPFAFSKTYEAFFINNNCLVENLIKSNNLIAYSDNPRETLFDKLKESSEFIDFDVEVIVKNRDNNYYDTLYIRKSAIKVFQNLKNYKGIQFRYVKGTETIYMEKQIVDRILNGIKLDSIIEMLLKSTINYSYNIKTLIEANILIYGGDNMDSQMKSAYKAAKTVLQAIPENKVNSYKQKLISSVTFKDYDRFCEVLLQLSSYSGVTFNFAYDLFEDFEENKNIAYTFINALNKEGIKSENEVVKNGGER
ncbi:type I CRISPR-associated protein Cas8a1/Csx8 [Clostridium sp.]|uniref:type I CRISPR-associated protein Cas8a1/Csx8 n=1 Tax=Clostridium sp. TaxID=1506 RepID=UPI003995F186